MSLDETTATRLNTRIAADVGGTFTDVAIFDAKTAKLNFGKTLTTPSRLVQGMDNGVAEAGYKFSQAGLFLHGTTIAINTMLERTGAKAALVTTRGFRDIYEIGRINRPDAYNLFFRKHKPLIERALRYEVDQRMNAAGEILRPLVLDDLEAIAEKMAAEKVDAIAILFIHSYRNPAHEIAARRFFESRFPNAFITTSHELSNEYREFERTSTVAANAYVGPRVKTYLGEVTEHLEKENFDGRFLIVQSTGGLYGKDQASRECIRMLESGPAAGVIATKTLCETIGLDRAIAFDMGGTTAKAGVIRNGVPLMAGSVMIGGYNEGLPIQIPMIDIREIGTGGGSIARLGPGGSLRVGPESAGAVPGPVCYGFGGTEPTVTDANLILGRLAPERFLGGNLKLDLKATRDALANHIAKPLGMSLEEAAEGIIRIAASTMSNVVKAITTERGLDARDFAFVAFGGAGPLHACLIARELRIAEVIIPNAPGHFSAFGMLISDCRRDFVRTMPMRLTAESFDKLEAAYQEMEREGITEVRNSAATDAPMETVRSADMRYVGQEHAVSVDLPMNLFQRRDHQGIKAEFDRVHAEHYGYAAEAEPAEIVSLRCGVIGVLPKPVLGKLEQGGEKPPAQAKLGSRSVHFNDGKGLRDTPVYDRTKLLAGNCITGPALIEEHASTTVVLPGDNVKVDDFGNLIIKVDLR